MADSNAAPDGARQGFVSSVSQPDDAIDLSAAALWIAAEEYPDLDVAAELARLDALGREARDALGDVADERERITGLCRFLYEECGFAPNTADYYDPRNSHLNQVLARRTGIPITLALVWLHVARHVGIDARGVSFPAHFLLRCRTARGALIVDPFTGELLTRDECLARFQTAAGSAVPFDERALAPADPRSILARVLGNLKQIHAAQGHLERALADCERILILFPGAEREVADRAVLRRAVEKRRRTLH